MFSSPFGRPRGRLCNAEDITGLESLPASAGMGAKALPGALRMRPTVLGAARLILFGIFVLGCAPSRPIAPVRVATSEAMPAGEFDADQRARLDALHVALAAPQKVAEPRKSAGTARPAPSDGLVVRLAFDEAADLDLFVTDPMQESVYFANSPTRSGGTLIDDRRCDDPSPRVEVVHFAEPAPGRYRVGVDFHRRCRDTPLSGTEEKQGLYVVRVEEGARILEREGKVVPGQFEIIVLEFDLE